MRSGLRLRARPNTWFQLRKTVHGRARPVGTLHPALVSGRIESGDAPREDGERLRNFAGSTERTLASNPVVWPSCRPNKLHVSSSVSVRTSLAAIHLVGCKMVARNCYANAVNLIMDATFLLGILSLERCAVCAQTVSGRRIALTEASVDFSALLAAFTYTQYALTCTAAERAVVRVSEVFRVCIWHGCSNLVQNKNVCKIYKFTNHGIILLTD